MPLGGCGSLGTIPASIHPHEDEAHQGCDLCARSLAGVDGLEPPSPPPVPASDCMRRHRRGAARTAPQPGLSGRSKARSAYACLGSGQGQRVSARLVMCRCTAPQQRTCLFKTLASLRWRGEGCVPGTKRQPPGNNLTAYM
eukprot:356755-Chlamydomonas_euryale.AAC.3